MQCWLLRFVGLQSSFLRGHPNGSGHGRHHRRDHERRPTGSLLLLPGEHYLGQPALSLQRRVKHSEELKGWTAATKRFSFIQQCSSAKERTSAICFFVSRKYRAKFHKAIKHKPFQFQWLYLEHFPKYEKYCFYLAEDSLSKCPASFWSQSCLMLDNLVIWCVFVNQLCTDWKYAIISMNAATKCVTFQTELWTGFPLCFFRHSSRGFWCLQSPAGPAGSLMTTNRPKENAFQSTAGSQKEDHHGDKFN